MESAMRKTKRKACLKEEAGYKTQKTINEERKVIDKYYYCFQGGIPVTANHRKKSTRIQTNTRIKA